MVLLVPDLSSARNRLVNAFPEKLAKVVVHRWDHMVVGDYVTPPCPPERLLRQLLDTLYLAAASPEEGRYPQFNILAVPSNDSLEGRSLRDVWELTELRPLSVDEIRRIAPAVDFKKSAILMKWDAKRWHIAGLVDLGTSWSRARIGLQYHYEYPSCLFVQIDRPGHIKVYQGQFLVAELTDGKLTRHSGMDISLVLHAPTHNGLNRIWRKIKYPKIEEPREYEGFQFIAFWNVFASLANSIRDENHGGAIIIVPGDRAVPEKQLRVKYRQSSSILKDAFISYMNIRHRVIDFVIQRERGDESVKGEWALAELELADSHTRLVEAIRFVARLSGCDGGIVISDDLQLLGFGAEIRSELRRKTKVREAIDTVRRKYKPLDVEHFGLRHRSAIKLISQQPKSYVLVVSQDGPISAIWSDKSGVVDVSRGISLVNMNMPWA